MKTLYTALFGDYDVVNKLYPQKGWRYVLFTDQDVQPKGWEVIKRPTPEDPVREARHHKIIIPNELRDDEVTIWVDANIIPTCDLSEFADRYPGKFIIRQHPRGSIFEEGDACITRNKGVKEEIENQLYTYRANGFPDKCLMAETGVIVRKDPCDDFCGKWWTHVKGFSTRDQIAFPYVMRETKFNPTIIPWDRLLNDFEIKFHIKDIDNGKV